MANACIINDIQDVLGYCCDLGSSVCSLKATPFLSVLGEVVVVVVLCCGSDIDCVWWWLYVVVVAVHMEVMVIYVWQSCYNCV